MTEAEIQAGVLQGLAARKLFCWRANTGKAMLGERMVSFGLKGQGDVLGMFPWGQFLAIECKSDTGRQSNDQIRFMLAVQRNRGVYILARDVTETLATIDQLLNAPR